MASPRSIHQVEADSSALPEVTSTGEARDTPVCSPDTESAVALQHSGSGVIPTAGEGRTFSSSDWNMLVMECSSLAANWRMVSTCLGLPKDMVDQIEGDHPKSVERCWSEALGKWIQQNAPRDVYGLPSWSTLLKAVVMVDPHLARKLAAKHQCSLEEPTSLSPQAMDENDPAVTKAALAEITSQFAALVIEVRKALEIKVDTKDVEVKDVRQFLVDFFAGECTIPKGADLCEIFESVSLAKLWRYDHHKPLQKLAEYCLPKEHPAVGHTTEYIKRYAGFCATTSLFSFVKLSELQDSGLEEDNQIFSPKKYNRFYKKLTVELKLKKAVSELTLKYVNELWESLQEEFDLPPLTAVIDKIVQGSLKITWLLLPHTVEKIRTTFYKSLNFLQQHNIIKIDLYGGDFLLYDEEWFEGSTHLYRACFTGSLEEVKRLLDGGANMNEQNDNDFGETPLIGACRTGDLDTVTLLLQYRADVDFKDKYGETALISASNYGHTKVIKVLLEYRVSVNQQSKYGTTALMLACVYGDADMVKMLVEHGATVDQRNKDGSSALMAASQYGNIENVEILLQCGAVVDLTDNISMTALMYASIRGQTDCARALLQAKAQVDHKDNYGVTALWAACDEDHSQTAQLLISFGANVNQPFDYEDGGTVLSLASKKGYTQIVLLLLSHGAIVDHQDKKGQSPLHLAVTSGQIETAKVLLESGVHVNLQDENGWTGLFVAAQQGHDEIVKMLLKNGADPKIASKTGLTALDVATNESHHTVCQLLEAHGAKVNTQLTEEQKIEAKSVREKIWSQFKKLFLRELARKEEETGMSLHTIGEVKGQRSRGSRLIPKRLRNLFNLT